jgi:protein-L-isoaspartate(D-aspartate) O-methyltransferase
MIDFATRRRLMVDSQVRPSDVTEFPIIEAMLTIPREVFVPRDRAEAAYMSDHVDIGGGRVLLDPRVFAKMLEVLDLSNADFVLDVGAGYGYSSAVISRIAEAVVALEDDADRALEMAGLLTEHQADNVVLHEAPLTEGAPEHGPYDAMLIEGGVETVPEALLDQLKEGGRIAACFMDGALGTVRLGRKIDGVVSWRFAFNATAPLLPGFDVARDFAL